MTAMEKATFGAGCFWGVEEAFTHLPGVVETEVGYSGGQLANPTYRQVCRGDTGHAETVRIKFDPAVINYAELLSKFWEIHDPTTKNRQGPDVGSQYRSAIFYHTDEQKTSAEESRRALGQTEKYDQPIVTEILPAGDFYRAEEYHQQYLHKQGRATCHT